MNNYKKLCTEMYDLDKPDVPMDALSFYMDYAKKSAGPVLEPMCGSGRFLLPLSESGIVIDGFDNSSYMLEACKRKCEAKQLNPKLWIQNIEDFDADGQYALIIIPAASFGLIITDDEITKSLNRLKAHLLPGGTLVMEIETPSCKPENSDKWVETKRGKRSNGDTLVENIKTDYDTEKKLSHYHLKYNLVVGGEIVESECMDFVTKLYYRDEFKETLIGNGFKDVRSLKTYDQSEAGNDDGVVVYECQ